MDPVTIVGLIGAATSLAFTCGRIIKGLHDLKEKYNDTNATLGNILLECRTLDTAATLIKEWIEGTPVGLQRRLDQLNEALIGFEDALKPLHQDVLDMLNKAKPSGVLPHKVKLSAIWNETQMKEHLDNVRWRGQAIQLILAATLLPQQKSLERIEVIARSVSSPQASRDSTLFSDSSSALSDTEFDFDHELINTVAYRRALRSFFRGTGEEMEPANKIDKEERDVEDLISFSPDLPASKENCNDLELESDYEIAESFETAIRLESMRIMGEENEVPRDDGGLGSSNLEGEPNVTKSTKAAQVHFAAGSFRSEAGQIPDLIVGVDFGLTSTAVAFIESPGGPVRCIQRWPGRSFGLEYRVPSVITYNKHQPLQVSCWGFLSEHPSQILKDEPLREWFKTYLDPARLPHEKRLYDPDMTQENVDRWCEDYLRCLYCCIEKKLRGELLQPWAAAAVQFLFTVPNDWARNTIERFRDIVFKAGFGVSPSHTMHVGITEAEAAVFHAYDCFPQCKMEALGQFLLVCDAGKSETNVCLFRVLDDDCGSVSLQKVHAHANTRMWHLTRIDNSFEALARQRLQQADKITCLEIHIEDAAWKMVQSREFQNAKFEYGAEDDPPTYFFVPVPGIHLDYRNDMCGIANGEMIFRREEVGNLFDVEMEKLLELLRSQLQVMEKLPPHRVVQILLQGEFGNVPYVFGKIQSAFLGDQIQVRVCPEPMLAVAKGLVKLRERSLRSAGVWERPKEVQQGIEQKQQGTGKKATFSRFRAAIGLKG